MAANDDYAEEVADTLLVEITPALKALVLARREQLLALKKEDAMVYEITGWDNSPNFIKMSQFDEATDYTYEKQLENKEVVEMPSGEFATLVEDLEGVTTDVVLLHVKEEGIRWTGVYKYSNVEFFTGTIPFELIENM